MKRTILVLLATFVLLPQIAWAQDSMDLAPATQFVATGTSFEVGLDADFASSVIGGELRVEYDPGVVDLQAVDWNLAYGDDPLLRCPPQNGPIGSRGCEGRPDFVALGNLNGLPTGDVGDLVFSAVAEGKTTVRLVAISPFADPSGRVVAVTLGESEVTVVPEPGVGMALMFGGLAIAATQSATQRRKRSAAAA
jgi:hypothetical protein